MMDGPAIEAQGAETSRPGAFWRGLCLRAAPAPGFNEAFQEETQFMPIYYPDILDQKSAPRTFTYGDKDVMLYALGIGLGADPMNETELPFVYERNLKVGPTAATVLAYNASRGGG